MKKFEWRRMRLTVTGEKTADTFAAATKKFFIVIITWMSFIR